MPTTERKLLFGNVPRGPQESSGCVALFGLPFIVVGLIILGIGAGWLPFKAPEEVRSRQVMILFGGVFAMAGGLLVWRTFTGKIREVQRRRALRNVPRQPWFADHPWDPAGETSRVGLKAMRGLVGLLFFSAFLAPFNVLFFPFPAILLFDALAIAGWVVLVYYVVQGGKYGDSRLRYATFPFYLGSQAVLYLDGIDRLKGLRQLKVTLRFVEEAIELQRSSRSSSSQTVCYSLYEDEQVFTPDQIPFGEGSPARFFSFARQVDATASLRLEFPLPDDDKYETRMAVAPAHYWELAVKADTPGVDYSASFLVPVYRSPGSEVPAILPQ